MWRVQRPGEIYEWMRDIPAGDCDRDGNQLDALGDRRSLDADVDQMASVTTKTLVSENSTNVACVTVSRHLRLRLCGHHEGDRV